MSWDGGSEADALSDWDDGGYEEDDDDDFAGPWAHSPLPSRQRKASSDQGGDRPQPDRWRCVVVGCNPKLDVTTAGEHYAATGHRVAKWPVRSADGKRRAAARNRGGYYDKYNVGVKSARARGIR